ncbi:SpoIID/LytB domain-containing protein [Rivularia sp. UHCC 0363]|uniref:SpoIID/LytB domain-containing protein n=1 Tax=Rivularia sp. UHCC 0363 TaxID=3110244 RepID=UPI002B21F139|nr:SpoIID/LytB domain-containing protein [Rivularia sp. UHCC 0363]MEA5593077.1 SpoIID/LytB domain-containing protein [Rivularia sp. UHCC 0363]
MKSLERLSCTVLTTWCLLGLTGASVPPTKSDVDLKIGIVQRFASDPNDELILEPTKGDKLKLTFTDNKKLQTIVTANPVKIQTAIQPLTQPVLDEHLILGTFRTFETAENSAEMWRKQGIEVEIAQPERWQVWAKREVYNTPLLRRLLLKSVKASGKKTAYVDSKVLRRVPQASWVINGYRYNRNYLQITSDKSLVEVSINGKAKKKYLYAGKLQLQPNAYGTYTLVNQVPLETYLRGVVPYEIGANAPEAAMEAQAIIARTYVLRNLRRFEVDKYQLCADTHCQVYYGLKGATEKTDQAIATTKGTVLTYKNQLVDALYSSTTGGVTAAFSSVWDGANRPYLKPVVDTPQNFWNLSQQSLASEKNFRLFMSLNKGFNESGQQWFRWRKESSLEDITKGLQKFLKVKNSPFAKFQTVKDIEVVERSSGGRILKLAVKTDIGTFNLYKDEVRSAFFAPRSTLFYLQPINKGKPGIWGYAFVGGGLGHGVGLSQIGAQNLASLGWKSQQILKFYYPGTQVQMLSDGVKIE